MKLTNYSRQYCRILGAAAGLVLIITASAVADVTISADGTIDDWGVRPFTLERGSGMIGDISYTAANDYAPINYPSGVGYQPSPGLNAGGEGCDLEEFYVRMSGQQLQFLIVTSTPGMVTMSGQNFYMGDLFIQTAIIATASSARAKTRGWP